MVDGWPCIKSGQFLDTPERFDEDRGRLLTCDIPAGEHESPHLRRLQCETFQLSIADALIAGQDDPASVSGFGEPLLVRGAPGKVIGQAFDRCARFAKRFDE